MGPKSTVYTRLYSVLSRGHIDDTTAMQLRGSHESLNAARNQEKLTCQFFIAASTVVVDVTRSFMNTADPGNQRLFCRYLHDVLLHVTENYHNVSLSLSDARGDVWLYVY